MNIAQIFENAAQQWPERIAIIDKDDKEYTFSELQNMVLHQASVFSKKGITAGDRVMVFVPMSIELYVSVLALFYIGGVAVFLDEWVSKDRMELCCKLAKCEGFIASFKIRVLAVLSSELRYIEHWFKLPDTAVAKPEIKVELYYPQPEETALITFTTGSTGTPKAANRTHTFLKAQFDALAPLTESMPNYPTGPDMPMLPIVLLLNLGRGVTSVIANFKATKPQKFKPIKVWQQIKKYEVVSITASPFYIEKLANSSPAVNTSLKKILVGGAAVFPNLIEKIHQKLSDIETVVVYGSTEAEPISHVGGNELLEFHKIQSPEKGLFVGHPDKATEVTIIPIDYLPGQPFQPLKSPMLPGEICVSGPHVLQGYINNPEAEKQNKIWVGKKCWHRTGDAGYINDKGGLFLLGRCKQVITFKDRTYYPFLVEYFMQNLSGVTCGTIILKGNKLVAVVQPKTGTNLLETENKILLHIPESIILFKNKIPMDPRHHSKIDYEKLEKTI